MKKRAFFSSRPFGQNHRNPLHMSVLKAGRTESYYHFLMFSNPRNTWNGDTPLDIAQALAKRGLPPSGAPRLCMRCHVYDYDKHGIEANMQHTETCCIENGLFTVRRE